MAGIGFELNKLLKRNSFISDIAAFFYSANVSAGPWIISSTSVFLIQLFIPQNKIPFLISGIIYTFIFSTILFGSVSTSVTRYLSDLIYKEDFKNIYLLYRSSLSYAFISSSVFLSIFFLLSGIREFQKIGLFSYSLIVLTIIWVQIVFISTIQKFTPVIVSFSAGGITSFALTIKFFKVSGEFLAYLGYNIGLMVIMVFLQLFIKKYLYTENQSENSSKNYSFFGFFRNEKDIIKNKSLFLDAIRTYKKQALAGFFTYLAAWIDDFIAWGHFKYSISKGFVFAPNYDIPMFISYLFIIPTLSLFVLNLETEFYYFYRTFYRSIEENRTLNFIRLSKLNLDESIRSTSKLILSIQLTFALAGLILSKKLAQILLLDNYGLIALRFGIIGAAANGLFLYAILISYYFDLPDIPLKASFVALLLNTVISSFTILKFPGAGFTIGFVVSTIYVFITFSNIYSDILRFEFTRSKLNLPKKEVIIHENK